MNSPLPPSKSRFWERSENSGDDITSRSWRGVVTVAPTLGVLAAYATFEVMTEKKRSFSTSVAKIGCARGFLYWLPFGSGAALYYGGELYCRPRAAVLSGWLKTFLPTSFHALVHADACPASEAFDDELPSSSLSKALAGGGTGLALSLPMHLVGWRGFRGIASVPAMTCLAGIAAVMMPDFEAINRR